jgi:hypothetical protein
MSEPSVIDLDLFRDLLDKQVRDGEITRAEAVRCWQIHGAPMLRWQKQQAARKRAESAVRAQLGETDDTR